MLPRGGGLWVAARLLARGCIAVRMRGGEGGGWVVVGFVCEPHRGSEVAEVVHSSGGARWRRDNPTAAAAPQPRLQCDGPGLMHLALQLAVKKCSDR